MKKCLYIPVKNHMIANPTIFDIVAVKIPHPKSNCAINTMADFLPYRSDINPAPNVPTANPAKNNIFAITKKENCTCIMSSLYK